jgi:hypothetical protein
MISWDELSPAPLELANCSAKAVHFCWASLNSCSSSLMRLCRTVSLSWLMVSLDWSSPSWGLSLVWALHSSWYICYKVLISACRVKIELSLSLMVCCIYIITFTESPIIVSYFSNSSISDCFLSLDFYRTTSSFLSLLISDCMCFDAAFKESIRYSDILAYFASSLFNRSISFVCFSTSEVRSLFLLVISSIVSLNWLPSSWDLARACYRARI